MLKRGATVQKIRTFFFLRRIYVKRGCEIEFFESILRNADSISSREILAMRDAGRFDGHSLIDDSPLVFYSQEDIESEYLKSLIEENFGRYRQCFWNQEKIKNFFRFVNEGKLTLKHLSFLKKQKGDCFNSYYLCNDAVEQQKYCLRAYHYFIPSYRKNKLERIVEKVKNS